jgi:hypothetical protein
MKMRERLAKIPGTRQVRAEAFMCASLQALRSATPVYDQTADDLPDAPDRGAWTAG